MNKISGRIINHDGAYNGTVEFTDKIESIDKDNSTNSQNIIIPGFIDLHCHGGNSYDTMAGLSSIIKIAHYHLINGTTTLLPTTVTATLDDTLKALKDLNNFIDKNTTMTNILGAHLEGPFINPNKLGAQPPQAQLPNIDFIRKVTNESKIKVITIAPELDGGEEFIDYLIKNNIRVQIGHSLASYECCKNIMKNYKVGFTHLFNAMSGCDHRSPGVVTAALKDAEFAEIICDLYHVDQANIHLAHKCIPKLYAVSDAISASGMPDGEYDFANIKIEKKKEKALIGGNILAGSVVNMHKIFKNLVKINFSLTEAVAMTSYHAALYLNELDKGIIQKGLCANLIILDSNLEIKEVYLYGKLVS